MAKTIVKTEAKIKEWEIRIVAQNKITKRKEEMKLELSDDNFDTLLKVFGAFKEKDLKYIEAK